MRNRIRLTESDLHRIVKESVKRVMIEEGFMGNMGNRFQGAVQGFKTGANQQQANDQDAQVLWTISSWVNNALQSGNPQVAMQTLQNIAKELGSNQQFKTQSYGSTNYDR